MVKKLVGHIGVDSGTLMLVDPCYIAKYPMLYCQGQKIDKSGNIQWNQPKDTLPDLWRDFCMCLDDNLPRTMNAGVVTRTRYGDGEYPVYAHFNKHGEIMKLEVRLY